MDAFLERRREAESWVAEERFEAIRDEYRTLQRRVVAAYRPVRDLYRRFLEQEPQYDRRAEVYGDDAHYFEPDHPLTDWWSPLTVDEALVKWQNADDDHVGHYRQRQQAVLDAFADWAGEEHPDDHIASPPQATTPQAVEAARESHVDPVRAERAWLHKTINSPWATTIIGGLLVTVVGGVLVLFLALWLTGD